MPISGLMCEEIEKGRAAVALPFEYKLFENFAEKGKNA